jgi:hypothetical protein
MDRVFTQKPRTVGGAAPQRCPQQSERRPTAPSPKLSPRAVQTCCTARPMTAIGRTKQATTTPRGTTMVPPDATQAASAPPPWWSRSNRKLSKTHSLPQRRRSSATRGPELKAPEKLWHPRSFPRSRSQQRRQPPPPRPYPRAAAPPPKEGERRAPKCCGAPSHPPPHLHRPRCSPRGPSARVQ